MEQVNSSLFEDVDKKNAGQTSLAPSEQKNDMEYTHTANQVYLDPLFNGNQFQKKHRQSTKRPVRKAHWKAITWRLFPDVTI